ncbi:MAG: transposase [Thermoplasmatales archaeon]|jgi:transposase/predicted nucleic acid-binding Zn finger protein|nr:transposase [Candidatus Thermoplasmatota archaeon]MDA8056232.1 transposase [Thermoplasmatales archaeon]
MTETPHDKEIEDEDKRDTAYNDKEMRVWRRSNPDELRSAKAEDLIREGKVKKEGEHWLVHSQSQNKNYIVNFLEDEATCTCPDYGRRHRSCKHIMAVRIAMKESEIPIEGIEIKVNKVTYTQDWPNYDRAQTSEKNMFMKLLYDLLQTIEEKEQEKGTRGRKFLPMRDMVFASALKVFTTFSLRRFMSDINQSKQMGYVNSIPYFTTVSVYFNKPEMTGILQRLISLSSLPLKSIETKFATDSTGFRITRFTQYNQEKHNTKREHEWLKVHVTCGDKTNVITAVEVSDQYGADSNYFLPLSKRTHNNGFDIEEMSADKAYSSRDNIAYVDSIGGIAYIPFRSNATGKSRGSFLWRKMYNYYVFQHEEFMDHYHLRSNVESTNFMIKSKFTDLIRSKNTIAQINEVLLKVLCHNIVVLIQSMYEMGIEPEFIN